MAVIAFVVSLLGAGLAMPTAAQAVATPGPVTQACTRTYGAWQYLGIGHPNFTGDIGIRGIANNCDGNLTYAVDCVTTAKRKNNISENVRFAVFNTVELDLRGEWWGGYFPADGTRRTWAVDVGVHRPGPHWCALYTAGSTHVADSYDIYF